MGRCWRCWCHTCPCSASRFCWWHTWTNRRRFGATKTIETKNERSLLQQCTEPDNAARVNDHHKKENKKALSDTWSCFPLYIFGNLMPAVFLWVQRRRHKAGILAVTPSSLTAPKPSGTKSSIPSSQLHLVKLHKLPGTGPQILTFPLNANHLKLAVDIVLPNAEGSEMRLWLHGLEAAGDSGAPWVVVRVTTVAGMLVTRLLGWLNTVTLDSGFLFHISLVKCTPSKLYN